MQPEHLQMWHETLYNMVPPTFPASSPPRAGPLLAPDTHLPRAPALERMLLQQPPEGPVSEILGINAARLEVAKGKKRGETLLAALPKQIRSNALPPLLLHSPFCPSTHLSPTLGSLLQATLIHYSFIQSLAHALLRFSFHSLIASLLILLSLQSCH